MTGMRPTRWSALLGAALVLGVLGAALALGLYRFFPPFKPESSSFIWVVAGACMVIGRLVRRKIEDRGVGFDRSQIAPTLVAQCALLGRATAWIGAGFFGITAGVAAVVLPRASELAAAGRDAPGILLGIAAGGFAAAAGMWLERGCVAPPGGSQPGSPVDPPAGPPPDAALDSPA